MRSWGSKIRTATCAFKSQFHRTKLCDKDCLKQSIVISFTNKVFSILSLRLNLAWFLYDSFSKQYIRILDIRKFTWHQNLSCGCRSNQCMSSSIKLSLSSQASYAAPSFMFRGGGWYTTNFTSCLNLGSWKRLHVLRFYFHLTQFIYYF